MSIYRPNADEKQAIEDLKSYMFEKYPWLRKDLDEAIKTFLDLAFIENAEKKKSK